MGYAAQIGGMLGKAGTWPASGVIRFEPSALGLGNALALVGLVVVVGLFARAMLARRGA